MWQCEIHVYKCKQLDLSENKFEGMVPGPLRRMQNLKVLHLQHNLLEGDFPKWFDGVSSLEDIDLSYNDIGGIIPDTLGISKLRGIVYLKDLKYLQAHFNLISGQIPPELGHLTNLVHLNLAHNCLSGFLPEFLCNFSES